MNLTSKKPFFQSMAAPRDSGKSYLTGKQLEAQWIKRFDHIYIFSPSLRLNGDYDAFEKYSHVHLISHVSPDEINNIFDQMMEVCCCVRQREKEIECGRMLPNLVCPETLIILDDCIDSNLLNFKGSVDKIAERGRHCNLSCVVCSQRLSAISRSIRINSDIFIIFSPYQVRELEQFIEQFVLRDQRKQVYERIREIFEKPYQFLFVDNTEKDLRKKLKISNADDFVKNKYKILELDIDDVVHYGGKTKTIKRKVKSVEEKDDE